MKKQKNPLQGLIEFYENSVKAEDKKGFAGLYKEVTENALSQIKRYLEENGITMEVTDLTYSDGYFIFGRGTNSVVSFRIKETPGWLYGIWWEEPEEVKDDDGKITGFNVTAQIFTQFEREIDKFKPSASIFCEKIYETYDTEEKKFNGYPYYAAQMVKFIHKEPELAFCREWHNWDYNTEYHSRAEAKKEYAKYLKQADAEIKCKEECNKIMMDTFVECLKPYLDEGIGLIYDRGEGWSPRYELFLNKDKLGKDWKEVKSGSTYVLSECDEKIGRKLDKAEKKCKNLADKHDTWWFSEISDSLTVLNNYKFKKLKESIEKEKGGDGHGA